MSYLDTLCADYWRARTYWRELAADTLPTRGPRDVVIGARILHSLYWHDQVIRDAGDGTRWRYGDASSLDSHAGAMADIIGARHHLSAEVIAHRAAALALANVSDTVTRRVSDAPDAMDGARHTVSARRSNSGRTDRKVTRAGVAPVIGADDAPAVRVIRGRFTPCPNRYRRIARQMARRGRLHYPRTVDARPPVGAVLPGMLHDVGAHLLAHAPRRGNGRNSLAVERLTATLYRMPAISDLRQHRQMTPELAGFNPAGVAVHRADMSGQTGTLALTETFADHARPRWQPRLRLAPVGTLRASERAIGMTPATVAPADGGYWRPPLRGCWRPTLQRFALAFPDTRERHHEFIWHGTTLTPRGRLAESTRRQRQSTGNRAARTVATLTPATTPETVPGWQALADTLNRGERHQGTAPDGTRWTLNRSSQFFSATVRTPDGMTLKHRTRTPDAIARKLCASVSAETRASETRATPASASVSG